MTSLPKTQTFAIDAAARLLLSLLPPEARRSVLLDALDESSGPQPLKRDPSIVVDALDEKPGDQPPQRDQLIDAICQERHGLRLEVIQMESSMHRSLFVFVTVAAAFGGIYWDSRVIPDDATRATLLFALSQVEFFLALVLLSLAGNQNVHVGYIQALEEQINALAGRRISLWDSFASKHFILGRRSAFFWLQILITASLASFFGFAVLASAAQLKIRWLYVLGAIEAFSIIALGLLSLLQIEKVRKALELEFRQEAR